MLKAGVIGAGHLGKIHLEQLTKSKHYEVQGFYDICEKSGAALSKDLGYKFFKQPEDLIQNSEVIIIASPTVSHYHWAKKAMQKNKHIFIEKPISQTVPQAEALSALCKKMNVKGQVGHVERFNPAFVSVVKNNKLQNPMFIEMHRLATFNPRGTDVPVVLDLMIHDIDIILSVVKSPVKQISASGVQVISGSPDIANARIAFENGCVANLTASRISLKMMRKARFFQKDAYITVDFLEKKSEVITICQPAEEPDDFAMILQNAEGTKKQLTFENPEIEKGNAILNELESFAAAIKNNTAPVVDLEQATKSLQIAEEIVKLF